jgi:hypothetical protein
MVHGIYKQCMLMFKKRFVVSLKFKFS